MSVSRAGRRRRPVTSTTECRERAAISNLWLHYYHYYYFFFTIIIVSAFTSCTRISDIYLLFIVRAATLPATTSAPWLSATTSVAAQVGGTQRESQQPLGK